MYKYKMPFVRSYKYSLSGDQAVEEVNGKFYKFTQGNKVVYVPEVNINHVDGFEPKGASSRKSRKDKSRKDKSRKDKSRKDKSRKSRKSRKYNA